MKPRICTPIPTTNGPGKRRNHRRSIHRYSENYLLGDVVQYDSSTGGFPTSRPEGFVDDVGLDSKLYPFKFKTAEQPPESQICTQCHGKEESEGFYDLHEEHVEEERYDCSRCHTFSRSERNLR